jgi:peptidyl-prolyl cis-trans isomerase C
MMGLRRLVWCGWVAVTLVPALARAEDPKGVGLPPPSITTAVLLNTELAELDRAPGTIVADVGNRTVTWADIADVIRSWPTIVAGAPFQQLYQAAAMQMMQERALAIRAEAVGLDKDPQAKRRVQNAIDDALGQELLQRSLAANVAPKALKVVYDGVVAGKPGPEQAHVHIIVTDTASEASDLIFRLGQGAAFDDTARALSKDGTAANGGDLGFVTVDQLSPEVGAVAFSLGVGQTTAYPVKSGNHWFIVRVDERRQAETPSFQDAQIALQRDVLHAGVDALRAQALKALPVNYYGLTGKPAKP